MRTIRKKREKRKRSKRFTEKSLSKGQRKDNKLVEELPLPLLLLETVTLSASDSESADFARINLCLRETQFPFLKTSSRFGEIFRVQEPSRVKVDVREQVLLVLCEKG